MLPAKLVASLGLAGATWMLTGCSSSVPSADVEKEVEAKVPGSSVSCPDDLKGKVGETLDCEVTIDDFTTTAKIKVTAIGGKNSSNIIYVYELADEPPTK